MILFIEAMAKSNSPYKRDIIYKDARVEVVFVTWPKGALSLPHDHGSSSGYIQVVEGKVYHDVFNKKTKKFLRTETFGPGSSFKETPDIIHIMGNSSKTRIAKTIHIYSPPIKMTAYEKATLSPVKLLKS